MSRVAVASLIHESNSLNRVSTRLSDFTIEEPSADLWSRSNTEVAGFLRAVEADVVPVFSGSATPGGVVEERAYERAVGNEPVQVRGRVRSLHAGRYMEPDVRHGGARFHDLGQSAVIECEGSTPELQNLLLLTSKMWFEYRNARPGLFGLP